MTFDDGWVVGSGHSRVCTVQQGTRALGGSSGTLLQTERKEYALTDTRQKGFSFVFSMHVGHNHK